MRIPFEIPPKGMKDQNETGSEIFGFVIFMKQTEDNALNCLKRRLRRDLSSRKKCLSSESMVKTQWRCWTLMILKDMEVVRSMEYLVPQVGQNLLWQRKETNLRVPQLSQPYIAPPKEGSPHPIMRSTFSMTAERGWRV